MVFFKKFTQKTNKIMKKLKSVYLYHPRESDRNLEHAALVFAVFIFVIYSIS